MVKIRITYSDIGEKDKFINELKDNFKVLQVSKEYAGKGKSLYKNVYIDISFK